MARVFITGSSDGLGLMTGQLLADEGHRVVLHARNDARAGDAKKALPKAEAVEVGDFGDIGFDRERAWTDGLDGFIESFLIAAGDCYFGAFFVELLRSG